MVFSWHFLHGATGKPIAFGHAPVVFPLALLDEGHAGVALFMTLSGYLFAKLLDGKDVLYGRFFWNRFIRLMPLLFVVFAVFPIVQSLQFPAFSLSGYAQQLLTGFVLPTWPNGGWSITVEMHFYILLPVILILMRQFRWTPIVLLAVAIGLRTLLFLHYRTIQDLSYYTIVGRFDQFLLGIMAFQYRGTTRGEHWLTGFLGVSFLIFYWWFDWGGGFMAFGGKYPSPTSLWIWLPTIQGAAFSWIVAYYDSSFAPSSRGLSRLLGRIGTYSYSIYLLHPFVVFRLLLIINHRIVSLTNFYVACTASVICFCGMACIGWASYTFIEKPFLRLRVRYTRPELAPSAGLATA